MLPICAGPKDRRIFYDDANAARMIASPGYGTVRLRCELGRTQFFMGLEMRSATWLAVLAAVLAAPAVTGCTASGPPGAGGAVTVPDSAGGDGVRREPVVAGRRARVFVMAGFDADCKSQPEPTITVTAAPSKGEVSFQPGQQTTIRASAAGTCAGATVTGTGIYYTARLGETGQDTFTISALSSSGNATDRTFTVTIVD